MHENEYYKSIIKCSGYLTLIFNSKIREIILRIDGPSKTLIEYSIPYEEAINVARCINNHCEVEIIK